MTFEIDALFGCVDVPEANRPISGGCEGTCIIPNHSLGDEVHMLVETVGFFASDVPDLYQVVFTTRYYKAMVHIKGSDHL